MELIKSLQNPKIKNLIKLQKHQERKLQGIFMVEGLKEIKMALKAGYKPDMLFYFPFRNLNIEDLLPQFKCYEINKDIFEKIAYREGSDGLLATFQQKNLLLDELKLGKTPLILAIESIEKPGNLGAILRTADAANVDAVLVCDPRTDIFNPNVVRSSVGCVFTNQIVSCSNEEAYSFLKKQNIKIFAAALSDSSSPYHLEDFKPSSCIVFGTEANGLSTFWLKNADKSIIIPMLGENDSLNVSVSTAVIAFEAVRQRNFIKD